MTWDYVCRIAIKTTSGWQYRVLDVESFTMTSSDAAKVFHPLILRSFATIIGLGGTEVGYVNSNVFPSIVADFGQWNEVISVDCYIKGETDDTDTGTGSKFVDLVDKYSYLRNWIIQTQAVVTNKVFLQLYTTDTSDDDSPDVKFDPIKVPAGTKSGWGYRGMVKDFNMKPYKAGDGRLNFTLSFQVGLVIPI
jgi:hypothetical protein